MKNLIPQVRFPEFSGEWEIEKLLKSVNSISSGKIKPSEDGDFLVYGSTGIIGKSKIFSHEGDYILVARVGANAGQINRARGKFSVTDNTLVVDLKQNISISFCESFLRKFNLNKLIFGSGQPLITGGLLKAIDFICPSLPEQTKIANFLTAVDEKLTALKQKKTLLEQYKKGVMQQIFSQELRFKDDNGNDFPDWEERKLGEVCINISYGMNAAATTYDGKNKYLRITDIEESSNGLNMDKATSPNGKLEDKFRVKIGDLLFARTGASVGKSYLYREEDGILYFAGFLIRFHVKHAIPSFIYLYMQTYNYDKWIKVMSMRSGQPGINAEEYKLFEIPFPSLPEQTKIANFLSAIDEKINHCQEQVEKVGMWKKGLLQQLFV